MSLVTLPGRSGPVAIVGAGPGDPGLLTVKALQALQQADVVLFDALVSQPILDLINPQAECIAVGKRCGQHSMSQEEINRLLVAKARGDRSVVRLKGGDPLMFGRGGEEMQALKLAGIDYYVVPGVTAASACSAYGAMPLTHRTLSRGVTFVTGHGKGGEEINNWPELAMENHTLVVYMGINRADAIAEGLMRGGRSPTTPVAIVSRASQPQQQLLTGTLAQLAQLVTRPEVQTPAALVIGEVVALSDTLHWFAPPSGGDEIIEQQFG
ncbi:uroporphyrinogen-III C-methyltransferase [Ferrimonas sediminum]|uniref:uroporphyrinogen-III C-methyltransferase n=1 Tax=Ferrimonas sediminum TaxID=718193 RepID=A0A1G8MBH0_9GAMM|nr:uroporphyrinogen-III C-methyltransferase [Ferrimonas sediminum]SDI65243.1 uroporphyrinogen-III C-methyltransferase [Ferrimonas sediminum]